MKGTGTFKRKKVKKKEEREGGRKKDWKKLNRKNKVMNKVGTRGAKEEKQKRMKEEGK